MCNNLTRNDPTFRLICNATAKVHKTIKQIRRNNRLVLLTHVPTAVGTTLSTDLNLNRTEPTSQFIGDYNISVWITGGSKSSYQILSQELSHHIVLARRAKDR